MPEIYVETMLITSSIINGPREWKLYTHKSQKMNKRRKSTKNSVHRVLEIIETRVKQLQSPCKPLNTCFFTWLITYVPSNTCVETDKSSVKM